jgi:hypothetical protein
MSCIYQQGQNVKEILISVGGRMGAGGGGQWHKQVILFMFALTFTAVVYLLSI